MCVCARVCEDIYMYVGIHYTILYFCILLKMSVLGAREMAQWLWVFIMQPRGPELWSQHLHNRLGILKMLELQLQRI